MTEHAPTLRYASVCSGIEAVTVAWEPLGLVPTWFSEIDSFANALLARRYPQVPNLGDMTQIASRIQQGAICAPDILVGGTPCQSFSVAGMRNGLADPRGELTLKYVELANVIDQTRLTQKEEPAIIVWENVPGVLSDRANAFGCFLGAICGEEHAIEPAGPKWTNAGCVYGPARSVAWRVLDAQYFGVAQRRKRVFVVASGREDFDPGAVLFESDSLRRDTSPRRSPRQGASRTSSFGAASAGADPNARQEIHTERVIRFFGGGNPESIDVSTSLLAKGAKGDFESETFSVQAITGSVSHALNTANGGKGSSEDGTGRGVPIIGTPVRDEGVSHTLTGAHSVTEDGNGRGLPLLAGAYRLDGGLWRTAPEDLPISSAITSVALRGRQGGVALEAGSDVAGALRASSGGSDKEHVFAPEFEAHFQCVPAVTLSGATHDLSLWRVRRLMPVECERLQGFPDHYTAIPYRGAPAADGPRYKAIGNSMAVPCVRWIGVRLMRALRMSVS
jgi:DNA (cytosine-5)-methyltransferase 1